ncbi:haloacid dehalogenase type II [Rhodospirillaceae bacterium SYSU D60014]|uniref:haloacid dehalogenase type II n=1 Tax=Virgifigura deserti TaxID=2268457 RepID=UPI000E668FC9
MADTVLYPIDACVFDAYGTLLDVHSAAARCSDALGEKAAALSMVWRQKQLEYTWLRSLMGSHADFWRVTRDSLDYALAQVGIEDRALRGRLLEIYRILDPYPEAHPTLARLKDRGFKTALLSNGSPEMLSTAVDRAALGPLLDHVLSVEEVGIYKPHPSVYQLAVDRLGLPAARICFVSSNGWDAAGAAHFGFRVCWINRFGQVPERLPVPPEATLTELSELPPLLGRREHPS